MWNKKSVTADNSVKKKKRGAGVCRSQRVKDREK